MKLASSFNEKGTPASSAVGWSTDEPNFAVMTEFPKGTFTEEYWVQEWQKRQSGGKESPVAHNHKQTGSIPVAATSSVEL